MIFRRGRRVAGTRDRALWGDLLALGFIFPISITLGFFIGRWLGGLLGHPSGGGLVGLLWGVAAAFWELYKVSQRVVRWDAEDTHRIEKEKDHEER